MKTPLVSIVLATYNGEKFLKEQLDSLISQTYPALEIIVVDDCSTDNTISIVRSFQQINTHIKLYENEKVLGPAKNFEKGIRLSTGEYIALCDQDDVWMPAKIEKKMAIISDCDLAYCDSEFIDEQGNRMGGKLSDIKNLRSYSDCLAFSIGNSVSGHACVFSRRLLERILPLPVEIIHDWWIAFNAAQYKEVRYINEVLVHYRQHSQNYIGAIDVKNRKKKKELKRSRDNKIRFRMNAFLDHCVADNQEEREVFQGLVETYTSFGVFNNYRRMMLFFRYRHRLLAIKKRPPFRKWLFCLKMFFNIS
ncbi:MAG: glycosyltransferase family 2 protein [Agriterribacter sp.]